MTPVSCAVYSSVDAQDARMCSERPSTLDFIASCYILRHCQVTSTQSRNCHEDNLNSETRGEFIIAGHSYVTTIIDSKYVGRGPDSSKSGWLLKLYFYYNSLTKANQYCPTSFGSLSLSFSLSLSLSLSSCLLTPAAIADGQMSVVDCTREKQQCSL